MEGSGTLGNSYQLGSALKERQELPAKKRASFVVPFCSSFRAGRSILIFYPRSQLGDSPSSFKVPAISADLIANLLGTQERPVISVESQRTMQPNQTIF